MYITRVIKSDIYLQYICDQILQKEVIVAYVPIADQITYYLTKHFTHTKFNMLRDKFRMSVSPLVWRDLEKVKIRLRESQNPTINDNYIIKDHDLSVIIRWSLIIEVTHHIFTSYYYVLLQQLL